MIERLREVIGAVSFHRGLALGALVGSAIAGSTIWARVRDARRPVEPPAQELVPAAGQSDGSGTAPGTGGSATTTD